MKALTVLLLALLSWALVGLAVWLCGLRLLFVLAVFGLLALWRMERDSRAFMRSHRMELSL
jgi:hypothetical protein